MSSDRPSTYSPLREVMAEEPDGHCHQSGLEITGIQVRLMVNDRLLGYATIILNNVFRIADIRIIEGDRRLFVAMPSRKDKDGNYRDIAHPIDPDFRNYLEERILDEYDRVEAGARGA